METDNELTLNELLNYFSCVEFETTQQRFTYHTRTSCKYITGRIQNEMQAAIFSKSHSNKDTVDQKCQFAEKYLSLDFSLCLNSKHNMCSALRPFFTSTSHLSSVSLVSKRKKNSCPN